MRFIPLRLSNPNDYFDEMELSPDQTRLATATTESLIVWEISGRMLFSVKRGAESQERDFCFLRDNKLVVKDNESVQIWDSEGTQLGDRFQHSKDNDCPPISPDGRLLLAFNGTTGNSEIPGQEQS